MACYESIKDGFLTQPRKKTESILDADFKSNFFSPPTFYFLNVQIYFIQNSKDNEHHYLLLRFTIFAFSLSPSL